MRPIDAAEQLLDLTGRMRGVRGRLRELLEQVVLDAVPAEHRDEVRERLDEVRPHTEPRRWKDVEKQLRSAWGEKPAKVLDEIDEEPAGLGSSSQVHRAALDGTDVAVKVIEPGLPEQLRADLQLIQTAARIAGAAFPGIDASALAREAGDLLTGELDQELEAQNRRAAARAWRGHPFVIVTPALTEWCREDVGVHEWVEGELLADALDAGTLDRDAVAERVLRAFGRGPSLTGWIHADAHPRNIVLVDGGERIALLDWGAAGKDDGTRRGAFAKALAIGADGDAAAVAALRDLGYLRPGPVGDDELHALGRELAHPLLVDEPVELDTDLARHARSVLLRTPPELLDQLDLPPTDVLARAGEAMLGLTLVRLGATLPYWPIVAEWVAGGAPATPLGKSEEAWVGG